MRCLASRHPSLTVKLSSDYADYVKLSLSNDRPIMLALKKFIPCYAAALCIKTHAALCRVFLARRRGYSEVQAGKNREEPRR